MKRAALIVIALCLVGCIPVTVRPERDAENRPIALPVTPTGTVQHADGSADLLVPAYPVSDQPPSPPPEFPWSDLLQVALIALGVGGPAAAVLKARQAGRAITALKMATGLVDQVAAAETDADVASILKAAGAEQDKAGVRQIIQRARGKA